MVISKFIRVTLLVQGSIVSIVEYNNQQYQVYTNSLHNCSTNAQNVTQCHIKPENLKQRNN